MDNPFTSEEFEAMSKEEEMFSFWCAEALEAGLLTEAVYQPVSWELVPAASVKQTKQLKTKTKEVDRHLHRSAGYTPDFRVNLTSEGIRLLEKAIDPVQLTEEFRMTADLYVDIKGGFTVQHGQNQVFELSRKLVYAKYGVWVLKVVPWKTKGNCWFKTTWCPEEYRWKKNRKKPELTVKGKMCETLKSFAGKGQ